MYKQRHMQPQDLLILLLMMLDRRPLMQKDIADRLGISPAAVSYAMARLESIGLLANNRQTVMRRKVLDFIRYAIGIIYPAELGPQVRGIPTARSAHLLDPGASFDESIDQKVDAIQSYVWKAGDGTAIGTAIKPIYPSVSKVALMERRLYQVLNLIDVVRVGNIREQKLAYQALENQLLDNESP